MRNNIEHFRKAGVEPFGVNPGDAESHRNFKAELKLPFELLVDTDAGVATAYGAVKPDGVGIERSVVVVGKNGKVLFGENGAPPWERILNALRVMPDDEGGEG